MVDIFKTQNKYDIIYADPAWSYYNDATVTDLEHYYNVPSKIRTPYPVMSVKDICSLPIKNISADNCILFMWGVRGNDKNCLNNGRSKRK